MEQNLQHRARTRKQRQVAGVHRHTLNASDGAPCVVKSALAVPDCSGSENMYAIAQGLVAWMQTTRSIW
jgi:hypothetical protein